MSFLVRAVACAREHVSEASGNAPEVKLPTPRGVTVPSRGRCYIELLDSCTTDTGVEYTVIPTDEFDDTPLRWLHGHSAGGEDDYEESDMQESHRDGYNWQRNGRVGVFVENMLDTPYRIRTGARLFQLITRDLRHMKVATQQNDVLYVHSAGENAECVDLCFDNTRDGEVLVRAHEAIVLEPGARQRVSLGITVVWRRAGAPAPFMLRSARDDVELSTGAVLIPADRRVSLTVTLVNYGDAAVRVAAHEPLVRIERPGVDAPWEVVRVGANHPMLA